MKGLKGEKQNLEINMIFNRELLRSDMMYEGVLVTWTAEVDVCKCKAIC